MSFRREPRTIAERLAAIEEKLRTTTGKVVVGLSSPGLEAIVTAKGDVLVGSEPGVLIALPVGADGDVLSADSSTTNGVAWESLPSAADASMLAWLAL